MAEFDATGAGEDALLLRPALPADAAAIVALVNRAFDFGPEGRPPAGEVRYPDPFYAFG